MKPALGSHVTLSGDRSGEYVVEDERPDGRLVLRPDFSLRAMLEPDERQITGDEFERHLGHLPSDDEG